MWKAKSTNVHNMEIHFMWSVWNVRKLINTTSEFKCQNLIEITVKNTEAKVGFVRSHHFIVEFTMSLLYIEPKALPKSSLIIIVTLEG